MFRETRRKKQVLSEQECADILERCEWGVLGLHGDNGYPYTVPLNYVYYNGIIYFHSARTGHKIDAIDRDDKASFCVVDKSDLVPEKFATAYWSVIVFGRIHKVQDQDERIDTLTALTPWQALRVFSTRATHAAQPMPWTGKFLLRVLIDGIWRLVRR